ncbi:MAG: hypothetical protein Q7S22_00030 [Candidatus Micrarchaeota archaeon]|nr:hypothetical protein [Candidatus Micrarchaeota archaeon]
MHNVEKIKDSYRKPNRVLASFLSSCLLVSACAGTKQSTRNTTKQGETKQLNRYGETNKRTNMSDEELIERFSPVIDALEEKESLKERVGDALEKLQYIAEREIHFSDGNAKFKIAIFSHMLADMIGLGIGINDKTEKKGLKPMIDTLQDGILRSAYGITKLSDIPLLTNQTRAAENANLLKFIQNCGQLLFLARNGDLTTVKVNPKENDPFDHILASLFKFYKEVHEHKKNQLI